MPKHEDDALADYAWGQSGARTGSWANELGYQAHRQRQEEAAERQRQSEALASAHGQAGYEPSAFAAFVEDCIPLALSRFLGLLAAVALLVVGYREGFLPPLRAGTTIVWESVAVAAAAALLAYAVGANVLKLVIRLLDICVRLVFGLLKLALVLGILLLLVWFVSG